MARLLLACDNCGAQRTVTVVQGFAEVDCPTCSKTTEVTLFPAVLRKESPDNAQRVISDESTCFFHPASRAETLCAQCGIFLCPVCAIPTGNRLLCPECMAHPASANDTPVRVMEFTRWDEVAIALAVYPLLLFYVTIFTAPVALAVTLWSWRKPIGLYPRSRWRFPVALLFSLAEIAGWFALGVAIFQGGVFD